MRGRAQRRQQHVARKSTSSLLRGNNKIEEKYRNTRAKTAVFIENKYNLMRKAYRNCAIVDFYFFSLYMITDFRSMMSSFGFVDLSFFFTRLRNVNTAEGLTLAFLW